MTVQGKAPCLPPSGRQGVIFFPARFRPERARLGRGANRPRPFPIYCGIWAVMPSTKKFIPDSSSSVAVAPSASQSLPSCFFSGPVNG